jgi:hypothetical protein
MTERSGLIFGVGVLEREVGGPVLRHALVGKFPGWSAVRKPATFGARRQ